ncbi:GNAT family N-acetyltransferase [Enterococcus caccae]|uniref:N-acetyltransferase domain-containing protein n=1 Tax=Enterococcus caccae ATCC BAA-1240 TaxID=1158612 RepID=R3WNK7_9ENTE|nr:GNAT family N-acetyltransferase [Enterococcus caccae]EOL49426.1 hypothetical protein UC7_00804 [Enterococcus caccae ATCC BAA-1240]EOT56478.1 hypothetical protein I580_03279 [Enterococcus caccae ATCC BAA-1240]OJG25218.1 hypothetical protein RU98_GL001043 [Enterococcus caccae]
MKLKQVMVEETKTAMFLLQESAEWLKATGSDQWSEVLQGKDKHRLADAVARGEVFFFYNNENQLAGMAAAWKTPTEWDRLLWKNFDFSQEVRYLHRVIIRPIYRGKSYGTQLISALKLKFSGNVVELRLDCLANNQKLIQFYEENGFTNIGSSNDSKGNKFELFSIKV